MKNIIILFLSIIMLASCGSSSSMGNLTRKERKQLREMKVRQALSDHRYTIQVSTAHPLGYPAINLSTPYTLEVRGDSIISYLPYFGTAYSVPYGGGKGLNFSAVIKNYEEVLLKHGEHAINIEVQNEEDFYLYQLSVFENGSSTINVRSRQRTEIAFNGYMDIE